MKTKTINLIFWIIITAAFLVLMVMHPRINNGLLLLGGIIISVILAVSKKERKAITLWLITFGLLIGLAIVWDRNRWLDVICPYHAPYEYKRDIQSLKSGYKSQCFTQFPDKIPDNASKVEWVCTPSVWQARGHEALFFYADEAYLSEVYDTYAPYAEVYTYGISGLDAGYWIRIDELGVSHSVRFPIVNAMTDEEKLNVTVLILYDDMWYNGGLYINQAEGYVCFFSNSYD